MKTAFLIVAGLLLTTAPGLRAQSSAFTYQGQLRVGGEPANGAYELTFQMFDGPQVGAPVSGILTNQAAISNGVFTVLLNFGAGVFTGGDRWLQVQVRTNGASGFTPLIPRQYIASAPYAIQAGNVMWQNLSTINTGPGIAVGASNALRVVFGGGGTNTAAARSDHQHFGQSWTGAGERALALTNAALTGAPLGLAAQTDYTNSISVLAVHGGGSGFLPRPSALSASSGQLPAITASSAAAPGVLAESHGYDAIVGWSLSTSQPFSGVYGRTEAPGGAGVYGSGDDGVYGEGLNGVKGESLYTNGVGVLGIAANGIGVDGTGFTGVKGESSALNGNGLVGYAHRGTDAYAIWGYSSNGYAGWFDGRVHVNGTLSKSAGQFQIDHPLDPENRWLAHSFVESSDMKNIYDGVTALDGSGEAVVELPAWFSALNKDYRYQLTALGAPAPNLHVAAEMAGNRFAIAGGNPGQRVSWQVTGIRQDRYALEHPVVVERTKTPAEKAGKPR